MLMTLTWKIRDDNMINIMVNRDQKIGETINILKLKGLYPTADDEFEVLQSVRTKERLHPELTYEQQGIYTGDILVLLK